MHLASISGGTDLCGCFVGGDPTRPVWSGEIQGPALGMAIDVFDDGGRPLPAGTGELVCTRPFPSQPLGFWGDDDGSRYHAAYYERVPGRVGPRRLRHVDRARRHGHPTAAPTPR